MNTCEVCGYTWSCDCELCPRCYPEAQPNPEPNPSGIAGGLRSLLAELDAASGNPAESYDVICAMERARVALTAWDTACLTAHIKSEGWGYGGQIPGHGAEDGE